jgi:glucose/mannose transport system substrate-binding protein
MVKTDPIAPKVPDCTARQASGWRWCGWLFLPVVLLLAQAAQAAPNDSMQVLHWWTSASERQAANALARFAAQEGIEWRDAAIPGGAGLGAGKVLRSRVLAGDAPDVTQIIGVSIADWAQSGLLLEFDSVAASGNWNKQLFPTILSLIQYRGHVVAAPLGVHRVNTLLYNRKLLARHGIAPPHNWDEWERAATRLRSQGVSALAQSSEPWQVAGLFESLVLAQGGPDLHRELFVSLRDTALGDPRFVAALQRLRKMKGWSNRPIQERPWTDMVQELARGDAAFFVMGDWAKGELLQTGLTLGVDFDCSAMPGTEKYHLYSVDTLTMMAKEHQHQAAQERLARLVLNPAVQLEYNQIKGSVSVRKDAALARMDSCARASWTVFSQGSAVQAPSLVHRMATSEASKDAIIAEVHRYFVDDAVTVTDVQRRLGAILRSLQPRKPMP